MIDMMLEIKGRVCVPDFNVSWITTTILFLLIIESVQQQLRCSFQKLDKKIGNTFYH